MTTVTILWATFDDTDAQTNWGHSADTESSAMAQRLMDRVVKALPLPKSKTCITYDAELKGFGVRITPAGARSFILNYRIKGRERRYTIGSYPDWSVAAAREEIKWLKRKIDLGYDPMGDRHADRGG